MSVSLHCTRIPGVLWIMLFLFSAPALADAEDRHGDRAGAVRWTLIDFTLRPQLAVLHDGAQDHLVAVGRQLPSTPFRLDALAADAAVLVLGTPDGQQIRVTLKRGETFDPEQTLREFATSMQSAYPPMEPAQEGRHVD